MRVTISKKIWISFSIILVFLCVVSALSIITTMRISNNYQLILEKEVKTVELVDEIVVIQKDMATAILEFITFNDQGALQRLDGLIEDGSTAARQLIESVEDDESLVLLEELKVKTVQLFESNEIIVTSIQ